MDGGGAASDWTSGVSTPNRRRRPAGSGGSAANWPNLYRMTEHELLRIIAFLERVRQPFQELVPIAEEDATWNLLLFLVKNHLTGTPVAISTLASVAKAPHATAMRRIHALIERGDILQEPLGEGSKRFKLRPSEALLESFIQYARKIKFLLAETFGLRSKTDSDEDFYFGGSYFAAQIIPPPRLIESLFRGTREMKFLLNDDNYFLSMRNMWADFRNNMASRKNFDLRKLPRLHERLVENAGLAVSEYDIVAINAPWLGEAVKKNLGHPARPAYQVRRPLLARLPSLGLVDGLVARSAVRRADLLHDRIARSAHGPVRKGQDRISDDLREDDRGRQAFPRARQRTLWHRLERWAGHARRLDLHVSHGLLRRVDPAHSEVEPRDWRRRARRASSCGRKSSPKRACACSTTCTSSRSFPRPTFSKWTGTGVRRRSSQARLRWPIAGRCAPRDSRPTSVPR